MDKEEFSQKIPIQVRERFLKNVEFTNTCWIWTAGLCKEYGRFSYEGRTQWAHRIAYTWAVKPIEEGLHLDHVLSRGCTDTRCIRPDHLEEVTLKENILRGTKKPAAANAKKTHCVRGHPLTEGNLIKSKHSDTRRCRLCGYERFVESRRKQGKTVGTFNGDKTHCIRGHPLSGDNLEPYALRTKGARICKSCWRDAQREARRRRVERKKQGEPQ